MKAGDFHRKNLATLFCSNMHFGCRIFLMNVAHLHQKYVRCWQGCCHVVFFLDVGHLHQKKYAKCWQGCCHRPFFLMNAGHFHQKKVVIFKGRDFDVHICLCSSLDPSFFWWWFNYRISYRDFQWEHGFHVFFMFHVFSCAARLQCRSFVR